MDWGFIIDLTIESAYLISIFVLCFTFAVFKGRQAIMNLMMGLYLALLISIEFPNYDVIFGNLESSQSIAAAKLGFFAVITVLTTMLFYRIMPDAFNEGRFESVGKKLLLSIGATVLIMIFSFHVLPVTEFLTPGTPIKSLFAPEPFFFWWLLLPLVILFIV